MPLKHSVYSEHHGQTSGGVWHGEVEPQGADRWRNPGDNALYKAITDQSITYPTSRFVQDYNLFTLASLTLSYDFRNCSFFKNSFLQRLKVSAYTNNLFTVSSVKVERGTSYPFARTFSLSAQVTF